ncbi:MAG: arsenical-resistance protein, partial [Firmicutes bacterium]|nr:arsenical-resistance protein [Bacillota bacterium]
MNQKSEREQKKGLGLFERYLTLWVAICMVAGVAIGQLMPAFPQMLSKLEYAHVSIPVALLIWLMIYPMMLKIDFSSIVAATKKPKGLTVTCVTNWLVKPFTMYLIAAFFLKVVFKPWIGAELATDYLAGAVLLGAA